MGSHGRSGIYDVFVGSLTKDITKKKKKKKFLFSSSLSQLILTNRIKKIEILQFRDFILLRNLINLL